MGKRHCVFLAFLLFLGGIPAQGAVYYVSQSTGSDGNPGTSPDSPKQTLDAALAIVQPGDEILLATGLYTQDVVYRPAPNGVRLVGGYPTDFASGPDREMYPTELKTYPYYSGGGVRIQNCPDPRTAVENFILKDNHGYRDTYGQTFGGGVTIIASNPRIINNRIQDNHLLHPSWGGGIYADGGSAPLISGNLILSNEASYGGGVHLSAGTVRANAISCNSGFGGGIYAGAYGACSTTTPRRILVDGNQILSNSNGLVLTAPESFAPLTRVEVVANKVRRNGTMGIFTPGNSGGQGHLSAYIWNNEICENGENGIDPAMALYEIKGNLIAWNAKNGVQGGNPYQPLRVANNTIVNNGRNGIDYYEKNAGDFFSNNVIAGNVVAGFWDEYYRQPPIYNNCFFANGGGMDYVYGYAIPVPNPAPLPEGNLGDDPAFRSTNDFRLASTSCCLDAGVDGDAAPLETDLDGFPRIMSGTGTLRAVDIGSYEAEFSPPDTTVSLAGTLGMNGWYISPVTFTLEATDEVPGSGLGLTEYRLLPSAEFTPFTGPVLLSSPGSVTLEYRSVDRAGNVEAAHAIGIGIDLAAPVLLTPYPVSGENDTPIVLQFSEMVAEGQSFASIEVTDKFGQSVILGRDVSGSTVILSVDTRKNASYTVTVPAGSVLDGAGIPLAVGASWVYTAN